MLCENENHNVWNEVWKFFETKGKEKNTKQNTCDVGCQELSCSQRGLGWGKITPGAMGAVSNVDKLGRGETSCTAAQAGGGARIEIWVSWTWVRLCNAHLLPCHPDSMRLLHHRSLKKADAVRPDWSQDLLWLCEAGMANSCYWDAFIRSQVSGPDPCSCILWHRSCPSKHSWTWAGSQRRPRCAGMHGAGWLGQRAAWPGAGGCGETHLVWGSKLLASPSAEVSLVLSISAAVLCVQCMFWAVVVLCRLRTRGYLAEGDPQRMFICWFQWLHAVGDRDFFDTESLWNLLLSSRLFLLRRIAQPFSPTSLPASSLTFALLPTLLAGSC